MWSSVKRSVPSTASAPGPTWYFLPGKDAYTVYAAHRIQHGTDTNDPPGQEVWFGVRYLEKKADPKFSSDEDSCYTAWTLKIELDRGVYGHFHGGLIKKFEPTCDHSFIYDDKAKNLSCGWVNNWRIHFIGKLTEHKRCGKRSGWTNVENLSLIFAGTWNWIPE